MQNITMRHVGNLKWGRLAVYTDLDTRGIGESDSS